MHWEADPLGGGRQDERKRGKERARQGWQIFFEERDASYVYMHGLEGGETEKSGAKGGDTGTPLSDPPLTRGEREGARKKW